MKCIQTLLLGAFITVFLSAETPLASTEIKIDVNGTTLTAELTDNSSADAFAEMLKKAPLTVDMSDYGDFEKGDLVEHGSGTIHSFQSRNG